MDDDAEPSLGVGNATVTEGHSGPTAAVFTVTLSAVSGRTVTVDYATADGTASQPADYTAASGRLTFVAGETSKTLRVDVNGDADVEPNETFGVGLATPTNAAIAAANGTGTILNDD